ncbi:DUF4232 domain-containing protein [Cryptosporangium arvum]|jgi:hypothetical protein|uniref:DUF4232 domain-containing protein n=1 Tax=Cryptosporangium arvum TaxID=80871 RepID=UPI0004B94BD1|nr:DUF4232 domain-containing protein [Cryptosporangium arvum]
MKSRLALLGVGLLLAVPACSVEFAAARAADPAVCTAEDIQVDVTRQPSGPVGLVALENASERACTLDGRATVTLTNAADEDVSVPTAAVDQPGPAVSFLLPPGTTAFQGITWTPCSKGDSSCGVGNGLRVTLPGSTTPLNAELLDFPAPEKNDITMSSLRVGTIQPSRQGVVAW